jgi:hypothetical protein
MRTDIKMMCPEVVSITGKNVRCMGEWRYSSTILDLGARWR